MSAPQLMLIEFNELCPSLLQRFMSQGMLPNFQRWHDASTIWTTDAEEAAPNLEPWIQWPTVHSGMPYGEHGIFHLGDGRKLAQKCLAEVLSDAGVPVGVCASMNTNYGNLNGYAMPDPWDKEGVAWPQDLQPFYRFVSRQVQESSHEGGLPFGEIARFARFMLRNGLTAGTVAAIARQLLHERLNPGIRWQRACLLDRLLYDAFRSLNRRCNVRFATFFCNSTAHFQHYYWRNLEPKRFEVPVPAGDDPSLADAIPYGYRMMDGLVGRLLADYPDTVLALCTALSQQPWTDTTKCTFRPERFEDLLAFARVAPRSVQVKPVMAEEFYLECPTPAYAGVVEQRLAELTVGDEPLMKVQRNGLSLFTGCRLTDARALEQTVTRGSDGFSRPFRDLFHMVHTMRSGRHHPDGVLWVRNGRHRLIEEKVALTSIAPSVLQFFGVAPPAHMKGETLDWGSSPRSSVSLACAAALI